MSRQQRGNLPASESVIASLVGRGLRYVDWERELKSRGCIWTTGLRNIMIAKEREMFKEEILFLMSKPNESRGHGTAATNSIVTIVKRLQGEEWIKGRPNERQERLQNGRLLGKDAKPRCFQEHIKRWELLAKSERETASALSSVHMPPRICDPSSLLKQIEIVDQLREAASTDLSSPGTSSGAHDFNASLQFGCLGTGIADAKNLPSLPLHENNPSIDEHSTPTGSQFAHTFNKDFQGLDHNQSISSNHSFLNSHFSEEETAKSLLDWMLMNRDTDQSNDEIQLQFPDTVLQEEPSQEFIRPLDQAPGNYAPATAISGWDSQESVAAVPGSFANLLASCDLVVKVPSPRKVSNGTEGEFGTIAPTLLGHTRPISRASDTSMPDYVIDCHPGELRKGARLPPSSISPNVPSIAYHPQLSKQIRGRHIINLKQALESSKHELLMAQKELATIKEDILKEKEAKGLVMAQNYDLKLQIARLEKAANRPSRQPLREDVVVNNSLQDLISAKIAHEALSRSKANDDDKENSPRRRRFSSIKSPLPLKIGAAGTSSATSRVTTSHGSSDNLTGLQIPPIDSHSRSISLVSRTRSESETSTATEGHYQQIKRKISSIFKPHRDEKEDAVPSLPSSPRKKQEEPMLDDGKRLTMDSGYASIEDADYAQLEAI